MRYSILLLGAAVGTAVAHPGHMGSLIRDLSERQAPNQTVEMIGDLATVGAVTDVGKKIKGCLEDPSGASCEDASAKTYTPPGPLGSIACAVDTCCVWDFVAKDLVKLFTSENGTCNDFARAAVRFGFHDAGAWSKTSGFGGADGSLLTNDLEVSRPENNGLQAIKAAGLTVFAKYEKFGVGSADLVQFMHNVAVVVCPLGPRQITFVGRADSSVDAPTGLLPDTRAPVTDLLQLFVDKTIGTIDLISLIGAHTTAVQRFVDPANAGPLDTTNGIWDVAFYSEALAAAPAPGTFRLPSDDAFSKDSRTTRGFTVFSNPTTGQATWNAFYSKAYTRLSLLGVNTINELVECTKVLPDFIPVFVPKNTTSSSSSSSAASSSTSSVSSSSVSGNATATSSISLSSVSGNAIVTSSSSVSSVSGKPTASSSPSLSSVSGKAVVTSSSSAIGPIVTASSSKSASFAYYSNSTSSSSSPKSTPSGPILTSTSSSSSPKSTPSGPILTSTGSSSSPKSTPSDPILTSAGSSIYYDDDYYWSTESTPAGPTVISKTTTLTSAGSSIYYDDDYYWSTESTPAGPTVISKTTTSTSAGSSVYYDDDDYYMSSVSTPAGPVVTSKTTSTVVDPYTTYTYTTTITETYPSPCPWTSTYVSASKTFTTSGTSMSTVTATKTNLITVTKPKPTTPATSSTPVDPIVPTSSVYYSSASSTPAAPVLVSSVPAAPAKPVWGKTGVASGTGAYSTPSSSVSLVKPIWGKTGASSGTGVYSPSSTAVSPVKFTGAASKNSFGFAALVCVAAVVALI